MRRNLFRETIRKFLHMVLGFFALLLAWLTPWQAVLCAFVALAHDLWLLPHYGMKKLERPEEKAKGYSGMVGYPAVVLFLLLLSIWGLAFIFDLHFYCVPDLFYMKESLTNYYQVVLAVAAGAWAIMAFGDSFAAVAGILLKGPRLPWNPDKRWTGLIAFVVAGTAASFFWMRFVQGSLAPMGYPEYYLLDLCLIASAVGAIVESLPGQVDDNLTVPLAAWFVLSFYMRGAYFMGRCDLSKAFYYVISSGHLSRTFLLVLLNFALVGLALKLRWVDRNGFLIGGFLGLLIILALDWKGYALLILFYVLSQFSTYHGRKKKEALGIAEGNGGRRTAGSVFSKGFIPALYAWLSPPAFAACLALYAADTVATEFGKTAKGATIVLPRFKRVYAGTPGGISLKGALWGMFSIAIMTAASWWFMGGLMNSLETTGRGLELYLSIAFSVTALFFGESLINGWNAKRHFFSKVVIHVMVGGFAGIAFELPRTFLVLFHSWPLGLKLLSLGAW